MKGFIKGLLFGSVVGGIGGLFLAPNSGEETKEKLLDEIDDWKYRTTDFNQKLENFKTAMVDFQLTAETLIPAFERDINKAVENFNFQAEPRIEQIEAQLEKIQENLPEMPETKTYE